MPNDTIHKITDDLLFIPDIIFRSIRQKIIKEILADITPLHFGIMRLLKSEGILQVAEIADKMQISRPQMTRLLDKLIERNMVNREVGTEDRRTINISLTERGKRTVNKNEQQVRKAIEKALLSLSDEDINDLSDTLTKLRDILLKAGIAHSKTHNFY